MQLVVFFLVFLVGCAAPTASLKVPSRSLTVHADTAFTPAERALINRATSELMSQVGMHVQVTYDLDFSKADLLPKYKYTTNLIRISRAARLTRDMDIRFRGVTFGWTMTVPNVRAYVASDVLIDGQETLYYHVVMHELLHMVGCDHVDDPNAVLYGQTDQQHQAVRLTEADKIELRRASGALDRASR